MATEREFEGVNVSVPLDDLLLIVALAKRQFVSDCADEALRGRDRGTEASAAAINAVLKSAEDDLKTQEAAMSAMLVARRERERVATPQE